MEYRAPDPLAVARLLPEGGRPKITPLGGDGSARRYFRVEAAGKGFVLQQGTNPAENAAWLRIDRHLEERGIRVPRVFGCDIENGLILMEDLGETSLFSLAKTAKSEEELESLYLPVLSLLVKMQAKGSEGFTLQTGFAPEPYGESLMVEMEGGYFCREFAFNLLGLKAGHEVFSDIEKLAGEAMQAPGGYFLHRDFQSRNLHLVEGEWAVIDFQGARPGPLGYDVSALILDPYVDLPKKLRDSLFSRYLELLSREGIDAGAVKRSLFSLGAFRLMQALGAFGKLGGREGKRGFLEFAPPALGILTGELGDWGEREYPSLTGFIGEVKRRWEVRIRG